MTPSKITVQQLRNFLNLNGIELKPSRKAPYANMGLNFDERMLRAVQDCNTFLMWDAKQDAQAEAHELPVL